MRHIKDQVALKIRENRCERNHWQAVNYAKPTTRLMSMAQLQEMANRTAGGAL
ncbi:hypothetical protein N473_07050 [Pseudoalteromonas luteoviolacea CPMOR-1]|uniref:Uncharacterized protein n=1 Tax=Pseudoalteromonas luteoviolacea CPMOR-1 TaxID=1365248 RepID=A0A161YCJ2_9GAMM|nr:hypothetical protein [Pseudoalteromonas luteoviolacea]KZN57626.1 hypothetical protein N473_07050 [Pseudoalteromonas luteoviolacea CPMOR-1]